LVNFDVGFGLTLNMNDRTVAYTKLECRINGIESGAPIEEQLKNFDRDVNAVVDYLKTEITRKLGTLIKGKDVGR